MKHQTADLQGALLDKCVANALAAQNLWPFLTVGEETKRGVFLDDGPMRWVPFCPSAAWADGGEIIERERIVVEPLFPKGTSPKTVNKWAAFVMERYGDEGPEGKGYSEGPTPLIAAMRAYTASVFGEEVDLP